MSKALVELLDGYSELLTMTLDMRNDTKDRLTKVLIDLEYTQFLIDKGLLR